ncbi:MAG TPA: hypothetical protein VD886_06270, partial [Herpetosiphonaceae bacterium]|nr:hypothetical protein [Herpetosiphonaceae bacterium]
MNEFILDAGQRQAILDAVLARLQAHYVFPDIAAAMDGAIRGRLQKGEYDQISDPVAFHEALTAHLREVCHDRHVRLAYYPDPQPPRDNLYADAEALAEYWAEAVLENYGYARAERLPGNIGYL